MQEAVTKSVFKLTGDTGVWGVIQECLRGGNGKAGLEMNKNGEN